MTKVSIARVCVVALFLGVACSKDRPIVGPPPPNPPPPPPPPPGSAARLAFKVQPSDGITNTRLSPIQVAVVDSTGTLVPVDSLPVSLLLGPDSVGATLSGTVTALTQDGIAVFDDVAIDRAGAGFTLVANPRPGPHISSSLPSTPFQVLYPRGTHLAFRTQPTHSTAGVPLGPVEVVVRDSAGYDLTRVSTHVTIALTGGQGDTLIGTTASATTLGAARFTDLTIGAQATGLRLTASAFGMPSVSSDPFDIGPRATFEGSAVAASAASTCALDHSGAAWCWGENLLGQLGEGREVSIPRPNPVAGGLTFAQISVAKHTWHGEVSTPDGSIVCGTTTAGTVYCWGGADQPFNGVDAATPKPLARSIAFASVSTGYYHACALARDGAVECWGWGAVPPGRVGGGQSFTQLVTGDGHTCALTSDGAAFCWGRLAPGLGNGSDTAIVRPVAVPGGHVFQTITAGSQHTCGIDRDGAAWCWGFLPLGAGVTGEPLLVKSAQRFVAISAGQQHTCALAAGGEAWCWGYNYFGELGDGTATTRGEPVAVSGGQAFSTISAGGWHTCALTAGGEAWCWGRNADGQLGNGHWSDSHTPVRVLGNDHFVSVSAGGDVTCGVVTGGAGRCWGDNYAGELGDAHPLYRPVPGPVLGGHTFASLSGGGRGMCGLTANHETWCWGQVRDSVEKRSAPLRLSGDPGFRVLAVGIMNACGIDANGTGWCWGEKWLGDGSQNSSLVPVQISGGLKLSAIDVGFHACALTTSGDAYCWGARTTSPGTDFSTPLLVPGGRKFVALSGATDHDCGLTASGDVYCWGSNYYGALGDGTRDDSPTPRLVVGGLHFMTISVGYGLSCGITTDRKTYCWRDDPNNLGYARPTLVPGNIDFVSIDISRDSGTHACGVATSGALYCWGWNGSGQLGNGATSGYYDEIPRLVVGGLSVAQP